MRRLSVDAACKDGYTCPSVHVDDAAPDRVVIVGAPVADGTVPVGPGEVAIEVKRQVIVDADLR